MAVKYPRSRVALFAREPVLGQVKTRLYPAIGASRALSLYRSMLGRIAAIIEASSLAAWDLWVSSNPSHECFISICNIRNIYLQEGEDLGQKMSFSVAQTLARPGIESILIVGTDCPAMSASVIDSALAELDAGIAVVIGPAEDGGYVLLGMRRHIPQLFEGISWGTDVVLQQTLSRLQQLNISYRLLEPLWDVDKPEDLARLKDLDPPLAV